MQLAAITGHNTDHANIIDDFCFNLSTKLMLKPFFMSQSAQALFRPFHKIVVKKDDRYILWCGESLIDIGDNRKREPVKLLIVCNVPPLFIIYLFHGLSGRDSKSRDIILIAFFFIR